MLQYMGSERGDQDLVTEQQQKLRGREKIKSISCGEPQNCPRLRAI